MEGGRSARRPWGGGRCSGDVCGEGGSAENVFSGLEMSRYHPLSKSLHAMKINIFEIRPDYSRPAFRGQSN